jgi:hypothetical protein
MALKDLLVYVDQPEAALVRLRLAVDLACRHCHMALKSKNAPVCANFGI